MKPCECGCGELANNRFCKGHNRKGVPHSIKTRRRFSMLRKGKVPRDNILAREIRICKCGCGQTFECKITSKQKYINGHWAKNNPPVNATKTRIGKKHTISTRIKMRQKAVKRVLLGNGKLPSYNKQACQFFKSFDEQNNTRGRYAVYGNGEYYIKKLGYWPDYINFDKKLIMEYDEAYHYDENGNLKEKDIQRQQEIQEFYPDFKFERIRSGVL